MATYMDPHDEQMALATRRGDACYVEIPGTGSKVCVRNYQERIELSDGRTLRISWGETCPPQPIKVEFGPPEPPAVDRARLAVSHLQDAAREVHAIADLSARDRNAIIGQLRNVAGQIAGLRLVPEFPTVPFSHGTTTR